MCVYVIGVGVGSVHEMCLARSGRELLAPRRGARSSRPSLALLAAASEASHGLARPPMARPGLTHSYGLPTVLAYAVPPDAAEHAPSTRDVLFELEVVNKTRHPARWRELLPRAVA